MSIDPAGPEGRLWPHNRDWVLDQVKRVCRLAKVTVITAHGLRGTMATIASSSGAATHLVSAALGHAGTAVTVRHYAQPGSANAGDQKRGLKVLAGGKR